MSEPNKDGTDIMMALLMGLSGPRSSKAWNESQQIKAESFLTMAEHWINQTAEENARLKAEVERLTKQNALATPRSLIASQDITSLREQVERLTKAVMHSPAAQLKLKELEGKTTFDEINPKDDNSNITTELLVLCNRQASDIRRLTKAGDEMADRLMYQGYPATVPAWLAAKEGKQP
jgi:leucyl-tRNA synthetase